jgi:hypothetical protein
MKKRLLSAVLTLVLCAYPAMAAGGIMCRKHRNCHKDIKWVVRNCGISTRKSPGRIVIIRL